MEVSGQRHTLAILPLGKELPLIPTGQEDGYTPELVWTQWQREKFPFMPLPRTKLH